MRRFESQLQAVKERLEAVKGSANSSSSSAYSSATSTTSPATSISPRNLSSSSSTASPNPATSIFSGAAARIAKPLRGGGGGGGGNSGVINNFSPPYTTSVSRLQNQDTAYNGSGGIAHASGAITSSDLAGEHNNHNNSDKRRSNWLFPSR